MKRTWALTLTAGLVLCVLLCGWRTYAQRQQSTLFSTPQREWEYNYDTVSNSFPTDADKTKIALYGINGWELAAVVREQYQTVIVFKRPKQAGK
jgi:hypothetical protein